MIYTEVYGVMALRMHLFVDDVDNTYMVASKWVDLKEVGQEMLKGMVGAKEPFLVDCILANWDVGKEGNIACVDVKGQLKVARIDMGGCLMYRAMGAPRDFLNAVEPNEHVTFLQEGMVSQWLFEGVHWSDALGVLKRARLDKLDAIVAVLADVLQEGGVPVRDQLLAQTVLSCVDTVRERHRWYMENLK